MMMNSTITGGYFTLPAAFFSPWELMIYHAAPYIVTLITFLVFMEQISYIRKKSILPGPSLVIPFLGTAALLVRNTTRYWADQSDYAKKTPMGVSANYLVGKFVVFIRNSELSHKVLNNVRPDAFLLAIHPFGKKLFGDNSILYRMGQDHKDLRRRMAPSFSPRALSVYIQAQQSVIVKHLTAWESLAAAATDSSSTTKPPPPIPLRVLAREMCLEISQTVFAGPYLNQEERQQFNQDYSLFNQGVIKLPVDFLGFAYRGARTAVDRLCETLSVCAEKSKQRIDAAGAAEAVCLVDFWMQEARREELEATAAGLAAAAAVTPPIPSCHEIGSHLFDFVFAALDAPSASVLWAVTYLESHPEVLSKVREEVSGIWSPSKNNHNDLITAEQLASMKYTHAVAREVLRIRAPAPMIPHIAARDFQLTEDYTIPKGAIVLPSAFESSFQGFPDPERFDPDRFLEGRGEDKVYKRNFLVFGSGSHQCMGQRYALNTLVLFIAIFTALLDFKRHQTDGCDEITHAPTICPKDGCTVYLSRRRAAKFPSSLSSS